MTDPKDFLLLVTHAAAFLAGGVTVRWIILSTLNVCTIEGHKVLEVKHDDEQKESRVPFSKENRHFTAWFAVVIACLFIVAIGAQAYVAVQDNKERDLRDREYADCLTEFAADLVDTIENRTEAGIRLEKAAQEKAATLDKLLTITELARRNPPKATEAEFDRALDLRVDAQKRYARVRDRVEEVRQDNQYVSPKVVCKR